MKKIFFFVTLISMPIFSFAQTKDMQKQMEEAQQKLKQMQSNPQYKAAMKKAQQAMQQMNSNPEMKKEMGQDNAMMDSIKKTNPALANMNMPDMNNFQIPNLDSLSANIGKGMTMYQNMNKAMDQSMPQQNLSHHAEKLAKLKSEDIVALAKALLKQIQPRLKITMQRTLNKMLKDTSINVAATGAFILASGGSPDAALFLICNGILKNPKDRWAINDLGVYLRDEADYATSLQCYFYANSLDTGHSKAINANIGWASAYYGDFNAATKYFDKALAIDGNYSEALEGEALLAYQKGDIAALFQCLAKEIKFIGGASGTAGPSDNFANICAGTSANNASGKKGQTQDPNDDHTFDNPAPDEGRSQDSPPGADVDDISYRQYKKVFVSDAKQILNAEAEFTTLNKQTMNSITYWHNEMKQMQQKLKPLNFAPYRDEDGSLVYPTSFSKFVALFNTAEMQFEQRIEWYGEKLSKKIDAYRTQDVNRDGDMMEQYDNKLLPCGKLDGAAKDRCIIEVNCEWIPKMYRSKQNDLDVVATAWDDYYDHISKTIQWFIDATAPFISRVHDENWNQYLNKERELEVRSTILGAYGEWGECVGAIATPILFIIQKPAPDCPPVEVAGITAPDPFSKKPKHIKEFEGPCYDQKFYTIGVEETCHATTISLGAGPLQGFYSHVDDPIYAQNHEYTNEVGTTISASKDVDIVKLEGKDDAEQSIVSASAGVEGSVDLKFDNNWGFKSGSSSVGASAEIGGLNLGGISATRTVEMVAGQLQVNPLSVTTTAPLQ